jgi:hypothetical protein
MALPIGEAHSGWAGRGPIVADAFGLGGAGRLKHPISHQIGRPNAGTLGSLADLERNLAC